VRSPRPQEDLVDEIVEFSHLLRQNEIDVSTAETIDATKAALTTYTPSYAQLAGVLRITLVKRPEQYDLFTKLFNQYWRNQLFSGPSTTRDTGKIEKHLREATEKTISNKRLTTNVKNLVAYSPFENLTTKKLLGASSKQQEATIQRNIRALLRALPLKEGLRYRKSLRGKIDLRATIRNSLETHGELLHVTHRTRKQTRAPIVLLCDVSGSMDQNSEDLLTVIHAIQNSQQNAETFLFSTELIRVSNLVRMKTITETAHQISTNVHVWGSGTKIGQCLSTALGNYPEFFTTATVVVIISDGWDIGDLAILAVKMRELRNRVGIIIWLNPWADRPEFKIYPSGLKAALPFIDLHTGPSILLHRQKLLHTVATSINGQRTKSKNEASTHMQELPMNNYR